MSAPRYPVYVPSKDRYQRERAQTVRTLHQSGVPYRLVVQPAQVEHYRRYVTERDRLLVLPEDDYGLLRTRNWIRDHAEAEGHDRHWQLDDNISDFYRFWERRRIPVHAGVSLRVCEDLTERFTNVGLSGLNYDMFVFPGNGYALAPFTCNVHVYSCTLVNHAMPHRWRLTHNDDTDICLQALTTGWTTLLVNAFLAKKITTMVVKGGNTDDLYADAGSDARDTYGRYEMTRMLEKAWPGVVKMVRQYGRYTHSVNWSAFRHEPELRPGLDLAALPEVDEYGLTLEARRAVGSVEIERLRAGYADTCAALTAPDPRWRGLPGFRPAPEPPKVTLSFKDAEERDRLVDRLGVTVDKKYRDKAWSARWPPRGREDPASLWFRPASSNSDPAARGTVTAYPIQEDRMDHEKNRLLGTNLVLACQRRQCHTQHAITMHVEPGQEIASAMEISEVITEEWPDGWGWDSIDVNRVLHCPQHRS